MTDSDCAGLELIFRVPAVVAALFVGLLLMSSSTAASAQETSRKVEILSQPNALPEHGFQPTPSSVRGDAQATDASPKTTSLQEAPHADAPDVASNSDGSCKGIPITDEEYLKNLAEAGNAEGQYLLGALYDRRQRGDDYIVPVGSKDEAFEWFRKAADQGNVKAQGWLCERFEYLRHVWRGTPVSDVNWCLKAAEHGYLSSERILANAYAEGDGVPQDFEKSYFWYRLSGRKPEEMPEISTMLTPELRKSADTRIDAWKPIEPTEDGEASSGAREQERYLLFKQTTIPINIGGLICGAPDRDCTVVSTCGDIVAVHCPDRDNSYVFASKTSKLPLANCTLATSEDCMLFLTRSWTCRRPISLPPALFETMKDEAAPDLQRKSVTGRAAPGVVVRQDASQCYMMIDKNEASHLAASLGDNLMGSLWKGDFVAVYQGLPRDSAKKITVPDNDELENTIQWRAAQQGDVEAQFKSAQEIENSRPIDAYVFYSLAAKEGNIAAAKARDALEQKRPHYELDDAKRILKDWKPAVCHVSRPPVIDHEDR